MSPTQKQTYFVYNEGYDKKMLRIGSLALDYANPRLRRPHIFAKEVYAYCSNGFENSFPNLRLPGG